MLLVEGSEINRQPAIGVLEEAGMELTVAENGLEAVEMVAERACDISI